MTQTGARSGLVVVSTRLPVVLEQRAGEWQTRQGAGGLVVALDAVLRARRGLWIGWPGVTAENTDARWMPLVTAAAKRRGYRIAPVALEAALVKDFYGGF